MTAAERIKLFCLARGLTQTVLARMARMAKQEVHHVGAGRYTHGAIVDRLAEAMGVTPGWLVHGRGKAPAWVRPLADASERLPLAAINAQAAERLADEVRRLRADVDWLLGVAKRRRRIRVRT